MKAALLGLLFLAVTSVAEAAEVRIKDYKFVPEKLTVKAGETVKWTNDEKRASHSIWFKAEGLPESERMVKQKPRFYSLALPGRGGCDRAVETIQ